MSVQASCATASYTAEIHVVKVHATLWQRQIQRFFGVYDDIELAKTVAEYVQTTFELLKRGNVWVSHTSCKSKVVKISGEIRPKNKEWNQFVVQSEFNFCTFSQFIQGLIREMDNTLLRESVSGFAPLAINGSPSRTPRREEVTENGLMPNLSLEPPSNKLL